MDKSEAIQILTDILYMDALIPEDKLCKVIDFIDSDFWIKTNDHLPGIGDTVLFCSPDGVRYGKYLGVDEFLDTTHEFFYRGNVTHWQLPPEIPND